MDPWLVDELTFAGQRWLYRGKKTHIQPADPDALAKECDAVILSQVTTQSKPTLPPIGPAAQLLHGKIP